MNCTINALSKSLSPLLSLVVDHPIYRSISSVEQLQIFMEQHVFAVWDFMCLLKELHRRIVSTSAPWFPPKDALSANLINSILVEEEGDIMEDGSYASHYELYIRAMEQIGANTAPIKKFLENLKNGMSLEESINSVQLNEGTKKFVLTTFDFFKRQDHEIAAAFVYGREGITSAMFSPILSQLNSNHHQANTSFSALIYYLKRHVELDDAEHFPKALTMLSNLMGQDKKKWVETEKAASEALKARIQFLTDVNNSLIRKEIYS